MSQPRSDWHPSYLTPRYWPTWFGLALLRLSATLPYPAMMGLGRWLGRLLYLLAPARRRVAYRNVELCFPERDRDAQQAIVRGCFESIAISLFEAAMSWWARGEHLNGLYHIEGLEHLHAARTEGRGVILLTGHYTTIEIAVRLLAGHVDGLQPIVKPARNRLFNHIMVTRRRHQCDDLLFNRDLRGVIRSLRQGKVVSYAPDQDFGRERSLFVPFLGVETATITTTARLARLSGAAVLPYFCQRLPGHEGYRIEVLPALVGFPSGDERADAIRVNDAIGDHARAVPEQYLWVHKRFKTRPEGQPGLY